MSTRFRPASDDDQEFLFRVYASTRTEELAIVDWTEAQKESFLRMQFTAQTQFYRDVYPEMEYHIVVHDGRDAGRMIVANLRDEFRLVDIAILPDHRNAGIGTSLVRDLLAEAQEAGKPVRIHVEHFNRARHLYERLGFRPVADRGVYVMMEWAPTATSTTVNA